MPTTIVWFRQDLRLADNPALRAAAERGAVLPVYVLDDTTPGAWTIGGAGRWWLRQSLEALDRALHERGSRLVLLQGDPGVALTRLAAAAEADSVMWNRAYEPFAIARDTALKTSLTDRGLSVVSHNGALLFEPWTVATQTGQPYSVYTPFAKACLKAPAPPSPAPAPVRLHTPEVSPTEEIGFDDLFPTRVVWSQGLAAAWSPGETKAHSTFTRFVADILEDYGDKRNRPDVEGTSRLSPHLHWGELSPRQAWHGVLAACGGAEALDPGRSSEVYLKELLWREFGYHILFHVPDLPTAPLKPAFAHFPWADDKDNRNAWRFGRTGYPIVDAGMRQLRTTGWMHNRVRMVAGSFLVKDLLEDWQHGACWFWDNLVDADLASNTLGWQWVAGCGPDAAPYFRIFNPVKQGEKFDPDGAYVRRWLPELERLPQPYVHAPWTAPKSVLAEAGVSLGTTYPTPLVDHGEARGRALDALQRIKHAA
ncbi:MAG: deoxyribodipyrimidine photo-lyase [Pseudomonadota bacterium]